METIINGIMMLIWVGLIAVYAAAYAVILKWVNLPVWLITPLAYLAFPIGVGFAFLTLRSIFSYFERKADRDSSNTD